MTIANPGLGATRSVLDPGQFQTRRANMVGNELPLQNGTPVLMTYTAPSDGQYHVGILTARLSVTTALTGGAVAVAVNEAGSTISTVTIFAGGEGTGVAMSAQGFLVKGGGGVAVQQTSAMTAGAATLAATITLLN